MFPSLAQAGRRCLKSPPRRVHRFNHTRLQSSLHKQQNIHDARKRLWVAPVSVALVGLVGVTLYRTNEPFRHTCLAAVRCSRVGEAVVLNVIDYKRTFAHSYSSEEDKVHGYSECHTRSAKRVLKALLANGGIFIKLGQHMSSLVVLPKEWTSTMRPLQDQCDPTPYEDVETLFLSDIGASISDLFEDFDVNPIGVASLAQVHTATHKQTGKRVAVKIQHPHLAEFCDVDMKIVEVSLGWVKYLFPEFEFTWLGEEMRENLPKEMDFIHEGRNAERAMEDFRGLRTSLYIPEVVSSSKRVLIMEFIEGGRVDDLAYLAEHKIDRNNVALEISRIFSQMVFINGWFHADPHPGNLLIRASPPSSKSPFNFEVVLLDHGLYFDIDDDLRINYSKLWLSLIAPASEKTNAERRKYAQLVGKIGPELYPIFEAAITGRAGLEGTWDSTEEAREADKKRGFNRAASMLDLMPQTEVEMDMIRSAVLQKEGVLLSVFDLLRKVPRRVLMVLKLNDLTRNLDQALATTHSNVRVFLITAQYCSDAVWRDDRRRLINSIHDRGLFALAHYVRALWIHEKAHLSLRMVELLMDWQAYLVITRAWLRGLCTRGFTGAKLAAAGLS